MKADLVGPMTGNRWIEFLELQKRGAIHGHFLLNVPDVAEGSFYEVGLTGGVGWLKGDNWNAATAKLSAMQADGTKRHYYSKGKKRRGYGFGWFTTEPLRSVDLCGVEGAVCYFLKYLTKGYYRQNGMDDDNPLKNARLIRFGQGCLKVHGCRFDGSIRYDGEFDENGVCIRPGTDARWPAIAQPQFEVVGESMDKTKREILQCFCEDQDCDISEISQWAEATYHWMPAFAALREFWRNDIIPHWKSCHQEPF
jgi:hypothetical protein